MTRHFWETLGFCAFLVLLVAMFQERRDVTPPAPPGPVVQTVPSTSPPDPPRQAAAAYTGNTNTHRFHMRSCRYASCKNCTARFRSREEAIAAGYRPGGCCNP